MLTSTVGIAPCINKSLVKYSIPKFSHTVYTSFGSKSTGTNSNAELGNPVDSDASLLYKDSLPIAFGLA